MEDGDDEVRITLRLPAKLRDKLTDGAADNSRSMNGEIVARLQESFRPGLRVPMSHLRNAEVVAKKNGVPLIALVVGTLRSAFPDPPFTHRALMEAMEYTSKFYPERFPGVDDLLEGLRAKIAAGEIDPDEPIPEPRPSPKPEAEEEG